MSNIQAIINTAQYKENTILRIYVRDLRNTIKIKTIYRSYNSQERQQVSEITKAPQRICIQYVKP